MGQQVKITVDGKEKFVGMLEGGTLDIQRNRTKHYYRKLNAYGMDKALLNHLETLECNEIRLTEKETGHVYTVDLAIFLKKALPNHYQGHGAQLFLPLRYWVKS